MGAQPSFDPWNLFLRETVQNSWDARIEKGGPIDFAVDAYELSANQHEYLRNEVFADRPQGGSDLAEWLDEEVGLLVVTDVGCRGLGGPTRADLSTTGSSDFVDFVRNVGRAEDKELGGGTYGFGKGVLYKASICSTILLFSRTHNRKKPESRFMAISLGSSFDMAGRRFTGRHWWGRANELTGAEPLIGVAAERAAKALGMTRLSRGDTGTAIAVVAPVASEGNESFQEIVQTIADAATWWAWPHMVEAKGGPTINFFFSSDGDVIHGIRPTEHTALQPYIAAYARGVSLLNGGAESATWPWSVKELRSDKPDRRLGVLAYRRLPPTLVPAEPKSQAPAMDSHIALMRDPRLVVKYQEVGADVHGQAIAGVFLADPDLNSSFALSEPVAHDDWIPANLELKKFERNPVKQTLDRLRREFRNEVRAVADPDGSAGSIGLTRLAGAMGDLLQGQLSGNDARIATPASAGPRRNNSADSTQRPKSARVSGNRPDSGSARIVGEPSLFLLDDRVVADFAILVDVVQSQPLRLAATPRVMLDAGVAEAIGEEPVGGQHPVVLGWLDSDGEVISTRPGVQLSAAGSYFVTVRVAQPADVALTVQLHVLER